MRTWIIAAALGALALAAGTAGLSAPAAAAQTARRALPAPDRTFVLEAMQGNTDEIRLGQLAAGKATNPDVRKFAQRMVNDHSKARDRLMSIPGVKQSSLPTDAMTSEATALENRLRRLSGRQFDEAYMQAMVADHTKDLRTFDRATRNITDPELKQWAAATMDTMREHLQQARRVLEGLKSSGR